MQNFVVKYNKVEPKKIIFEDFVTVNGGKFVVSKMWYHENAKSCPSSFFIQTSEIKVHDIDGDCVSFEIDDSDVYNLIDTIVLNNVKQNSVVKKYGLKNPSYKSIVGEATNNKKLNVLRFNKFSGAKFYTESKVAKSYDEIKHLLSSGSMVKIIFEVDKIIVDVTKNYIFTYMTLSQVQIKVVPQKIELSEYSFIDDDSESEETKENNIVTDEVNENIVNDMILNTQTEYMDDDKSSNLEDSENESENSEDSEDLKIEESSDSENDDYSHNNLSDSDEEKSFEVNNFLSNLSKVGKNKKR